MIRDERRINFYRVRYKLVKCIIIIHGGEIRFPNHRADENKHRPYVYFLRGQNPPASVVVSWHELRRTARRGRRSRFVWGRIDLQAAIERRGRAKSGFLVSPYSKRQMCTRVPVPISSLPFLSFPSDPSLAALFLCSVRTFSLSSILWTHRLRDLEPRIFAIRQVYW